MVGSKFKPVDQNETGVAEGEAAAAAAAEAADGDEKKHPNIVKNGKQQQDDAKIDPSLNTVTYTKEGEKEPLKAEEGNQQQQA